MMRLSQASMMLSSGSYVLRNAHVPQPLIAGGPYPSDDEGLAFVDVLVERGRIAAILPRGAACDAPPVDLDNGQVWPAFSDVHTHLDKGHIWPRAANRDGTHLTAAKTVADDRRANWSEDDVRRRFDFGLRCAYAHGTAAIRTHIDSYEADQAERSWRVFREMRDAWRGRIDLQGVMMTRIDAYVSAGARRLFDIVEISDGAFGGILKTDRLGQADAADFVGHCLDVLLAAAAERGRDIDLHIDETDDPGSHGLRQVAQAVLRNRFTGRVTCGHCCSLANQPADEAAETIALVRDAGIAVVTLPMVNVYLQGRSAMQTPRWRGITLVHELAAAGVTVAAASDNCRDPFFKFGDHDVLEVFREFVRIAHLDVDYRSWFGAVTAAPAAIMGLRRRQGITIGTPADLILFRARGMSELLSRPQADRLVLRQGRPIDGALPDYRELDSAAGDAVDEPQQDCRRPERDFTCSFESISAAVSD